MLTFIVLSVFISVGLSAAPPPQDDGFLLEDEDGKFPRGLLREEDYPGHPEPDLPPVQPAIDIFPPKWHPGDILEKTEHSAIDNALDDVMKAGSLLQDRRCAIGIANEGETTTLSNPQWAFYSGQIHTAMPFTVPTGQTSLNLFVKQSGLAAGTVGVLSYDIDGTDHKVAIMWSVPFDFNLFDVWFNMKVYPQTVATDISLWRHMYYEAGPWRPIGWETREEFGVKLRAVMTDNYRSKLVVWVDADGLDPNGGYDLYTNCAYHPGRVGYYCTQECMASGWCWVDKGCSKQADCVGRHLCQNSC